MKVKFSQSIAGLTYSYKRGKVVELPEERAKSFINSGVCVLLDEKPKDPPVEEVKPKKTKKKDSVDS